MNCGNVVNGPELKFATMKSSKLIAKLSSAAATIPGTSSGNVTFQNVIGPEAYRSAAASSSRGYSDAIRARIVTTTSDMQNMMWDRIVVVIPSSTPTFRNWASREAPSTTSGVASGRN